jgi:hypothetical protein
MWALLRGQGIRFRAATALLAKIPCSRYKSPVSVTTPKAGPPANEGQPEALTELNDLPEIADIAEIEELGDEAIISQQTAAHALKPRAIVSDEARSVVITEHPARRDTQPPRNPPPKSSAEATLVIRDRRALDEMRQKIVRRQKQKQAHGRRALYLWSALGLAAFLLGAIVAFLATDTPVEPQTAEQQGAQPGVQTAQPSAAVTKPVTEGSPTSPRAVPPSDVPVERKH